MNEILYEIVRSNRKTLALTIDSEARLVVRAPMKLGEDVIRDFIKKKARWITDKQQQVSDYATKQSAFVLEDGENVLYFGKSYAILRKNVQEVVTEGNFLLVPESMALEGFAEWMKAQGDNVIRERVDHYANLMGVKYVSVKMSEAKRRWGSCGAGNTLNFAWRLVMCPQSVIDYVVVHELSHITYKDHSSKFWTRVATVMPNYKEAQDWLLLNRKLMEVI
jgi:predicted metal-dependent hydrolase